MDVDNSGHEQYQTTCNQKTGKSGPTYSTTVKEPKKPLGKKRKICSRSGEEGKNQCCLYFQQIMST